MWIFVRISLIGLAAVVLAYHLGRARHPRQRTFWSLLVAAAGCWLAAETLLLAPGAASTALDGASHIVRLAGYGLVVAAAVLVARWLGTGTPDSRQLDRATRDPLTGLPTRPLLLDRLGRCVRLARRDSGFQFALLFIDLDRLRLVNESLGHACGDQLLVEVARRLGLRVRGEDMLARIGGDEFALLIERLSHPADASRVAERIQQELAVPLELEGQDTFITATIGIALSSQEHEGPEVLLRAAEAAMYRAKAKGKARFEVFDHSANDQAVARLKLETDLRRALERDEFLPYYQPIVALPSGAVVGFEALARWRHPRRGVLPPKDFLTVAEETELIIPMWERIFAQACRELRTWQLARSGGPPLLMAVNLSGKHFMRLEVVDQVESVLAETGLDPRSLRLEVTESVILEKPEIAVAVITRLKDLGIELYLDDFGKGYSSLSYLHQFPFNGLKIDRSFIAGIASEGQSLEIVRAIVSLGHNLRLAVVAEGIETPEQLARAQELRCEFGQGYLFSRPMTSEDAEKLAASGVSLGAPRVARQN